jgi:hypothetical protein
VSALRSLQVEGECEPIPSWSWSWCAVFGNEPYAKNAVLAKPVELLVSCGMFGGRDVH